MDRQRATTPQRIGIFFALVEACLFGFVAALHFGLEWRVGDRVYAAPFLYPAGITEASLALALFLSALLPGARGVRAGRVLGAQILVMIGVVAVQVALMRGAALATTGNEIFYGIALVLAFASAVLVASPMYRRRLTAR